MRRVVIDETTGNSVGLPGLDCSKCSARSKIARGCRLPGYNYTRQVPTIIDYHKPMRPSQDRALFCPASIPGIFDVQADAQHLISIRDGGGLRDEFDQPVASLPMALKNSYTRAIAASERLATEVSDAFAGKRSLS